MSREAGFAGSLNIHSLFITPKKSSPASLAR
jgi:hypothetical protein